jgi:hypothetical protein
MSDLIEYLVETSDIEALDKIWHKHMKDIFDMIITKGENTLLLDFLVERISMCKLHYEILTRGNNFNLLHLLDYNINHKEIFKAIILRDNEDLTIQALAKARGINHWDMCTYALTNDCLEAYLTLRQEADYKLFIMIGIICLIVLVILSGISI